MPNVRDGAACTDAILPRSFKPGFSRPAAEDEAKAKALINFLMQDWHFLALFRSNDPEERGAAMDMLNKAHHQAYGDAPIRDEDV